MSDVNISEVIQTLKYRNNQQKTDALKNIFKDIVSMVETGITDDKLDNCLKKMSAVETIGARSQFLNELTNPKLRESLK
jgi:hypothetical protein